MEPLAASVESLPVMVTVPVVPPRVPELALAMLMMFALLEVNTVEPVTFLPFKFAAKLTDEPLPAVAMLIGEAGLEVIERDDDEPAVIVIVPEITSPFEDASAAWTVTAVPGLVTWVAVTKPAFVVLSDTNPVGVTLQVAIPVRFLWLPSS